MYRIDPDRADLAREYKADPLGKHSAELEKVLLLLRSGGVRDKTVIICTKPEREWRLGRLGPKRGTPMQEYGPAYTSQAAVNWACFRARWQEVTGKPCPVE
ncbi:MAG TPA: hypothetical protein VMT54_03705 [Candidatus Cybelea sp.]|nr:hypothetical protein [Candidatus Cybelea sp.]